MTQAVTELIVRGDGALAVLNQFETDMENSGIAAERTTGAVANFEARIAKATAQIAANNAVTTQSIERRTTEQRVLERWQGRIDPMMNLEIKLRREAERAAVDYTNAVVMGHTTQEAALRDLTRLEQSHMAQLRALADTNQSVAMSANSAAAANDNLAMSTNRVAAANDNARGATANIAAQFQDVAVTAAMGMNPIMIALQQGTQLSSVLMTMKNPITGLATAFFAMLNPVSLLTIGFVALTAATIQFFTAANDNAAGTVDALEEHSKWLDTLLVGYDRVRDAATNAAEAAERMPEGVVRSDLQASLREQEAAETALQLRIESNRASLSSMADFLREMQATAQSAGESGAGLTSGIQQIEMMRQLAIDTASTKVELEAAMVAAREFYNTTDDPALKNMANDAYTLAAELLRIRAMAEQADAALRALPRDIQIRLNISQEFGSAIGDMGDLFIDPRSRFEIAREELENAHQQAVATAQTYGDLVGAGAEYTRVLESINAAEAAANDRASSRGGGGRQSEAEKMIGNYADLTRGAREFIAGQQLEAQALGMTAQAAAALRYEQDLLNKAANDNVTLTPLQRQELAGLAAQMASSEAATARLTEAYNFGKQTLGSFLSDFRRDLMNGTSLWDSFANAAGKALDSIADRLLGMASDGLFDLLFNAFSGAMGGGFGTIGVGGVGMPSGGWTPGISGPWLPSAKGNVFDSPSLSVYSNRVYDTPQMFAFAKGAGVFAEAGPEAIMPLGRDSQGRLGVRTTAANQNQANDNGSSDITLRLLMPEGWRAELVGEARAGARADTVKIVQATEKAKGNLRRNGG